MDTPEPSPFTFVRTFNPVVTRHRHDGRTPERQSDFIAALAEAGCVLDACRRVGMSSESAYQLRARYDAVDFRLAWDAALDYVVRRLSDAALSGRATTWAEPPPGRATAPPVAPRQFDLDPAVRPDPPLSPPGRAARR